MVKHEFQATDLPGASCSCLSSEVDRCPDGISTRAYKEPYVLTDFRCPDQNSWLAMEYGHYCMFRPSPSPMLRSRGSMKVGNLVGEGMGPRTSLLLPFHSHPDLPVMQKIHKTAHGNP